MAELPRGFTAHVANIGIKDHADDFVVIAAERLATAAGVFTKSRFVGPSVTISRQHVASGSARAMVVVSKNANVANGPTGEALSLIHISEPTRRTPISYAVFCL